MKMRTGGLTDLKLLSALESIPRENFLPEDLIEFAYDEQAMLDTEMIIAPKASTATWIAAALDMAPRHRVLEIGTGSGYQAAILSKLCRMVYTMDINHESVKNAEQRFKNLAITNIVTKTGDGNQGWQQSAPFDRILISASVPEIPANLIEQLADDGILVAPVGKSNSDQILLRVSRAGAGLVTQHLMNVKFPALQVV